MTASSGNNAVPQWFLQLVEDANPTGEIVVVTDNPSSHNSFSTRERLVDHPRIQPVFIPVGACWINLQEGWWRIFREAAPGGRPLRRSAVSARNPRLPGSVVGCRCRSGSDAGSSLRGRPPAGPTGFTALRVVMTSLTSWRQ
jgi:hypothetical protein